MNKDSIGKSPRKSFLFFLTIFTGTSSGGRRTRS